MGKLLVAVALVLLGVVVAEPGYGYRSHGYGGYSRGYGGYGGHHGYGKREAELMLSQDMEDTVGDMEGTEVTVLTVTATLPLHTDTTDHTTARDRLRLNQATAT